MTTRLGPLDCGEKRVAMITGAGSGIGRASAMRFASEGVRIGVADLDRAAGTETVNQILQNGGEAEFFQCDVAEEQSIQETVHGIVERFGRLDIAHNNAGISPDTGLIVDCERAVWDKILAVNLTGMWMCMKHQAPAMMASGHGGAICNMGSGSSLKGLPEISAYVASKHGVVGLTKVAALEFAPHIRVNVVCPGPTNTPGIRTKSESSDAGFSLDEFMKSVPLRRMAGSDELAQAVVWLCSDEASYATGAIVSIDGGLVLS